MTLHAAIDFGISNTDVIARIDGEITRWNEPYVGDPDEASVRAILAAGGVKLDDLTHLAVTGGRHRLLPDQLGRATVVKVNEVQAIGRGGQAILGLTGAARELPLLIVSAGSGTALIKAQGDAMPTSRAPAWAAARCWGWRACSWAPWTLSKSATWPLPATATGLT